MAFIATFFSHFGSVRFKKICDSRGVQAKIMPVPRNLSSSCGTCVRFESESWDFYGDVTDELEQIVEILADGYKLLFKAEDS